MTLTSAIEITGVLLAFSIMVQTIEYLWVRTAYVESGIWRWSAVRDDFSNLPTFVQRMLDGMLGDTGFRLLLWGRLLAAGGVVLFPHLFVVCFLIVSSGLVTLRWRGAYNGGSDYMTWTVLIAWSFALLAGSDSSHYWVSRAALGYIAVQVIFSYTISGWAKLLQPTWRNGTALVTYLRGSHYGSPTWVADYLASTSFGRKLASGMVLVFECAFPFVLLGKPWIEVWLVAAILFHMINIYLFGLNRFLWAWLAAYPALYFTVAR